MTRSPSAATRNAPRGSPTPATMRAGPGGVWGGGPALLGGQALLIESRAGYLLGAAGAAAGAERQSLGGGCSGGSHLGTSTAKGIILTNFNLYFPLGIVKGGQEGERNGAGRAKTGLRSLPARGADRPDEHGLWREVLAVLVPVRQNEPPRWGDHEFAGQLPRV